MREGLALEYALQLAIGRDGSRPVEAKAFMNVPAKTGSMSVQLTDVDGTTSATRSFNVTK